VNKRQLIIIRHFLSVIIVTLVVVFGLMNLRDMINKSESLREMGELGKAVKDYHKKNGSFPPESWIKPLENNFARLGNLNYRAQQVFFDSPPETILAYNKYRSYAIFVPSGYAILQVDGQVKWMLLKEFDKVFAQQEKDQELELYRFYRKSGN
jgi:hypothetical protein